MRRLNMKIVKRHFESWLLQIVVKILDRNVQRAEVIDRKDNNMLFEFAYDIEQIAQRIKNGYE